jgi:hypothetical protein
MSTVTNEDVVRDVLGTIRPDFYGEVTLQFHRGLITHTKTTEQKKYNTSKATSPEETNDTPRK